MPRDTSTDQITNDLITVWAKIVANVSGWGVLSNGNKAVYPNLGFPQPQEPFPAGYIYLMGQSPDLVQGTGLRRDTITIATRIIGGPLTNEYATVPEIEVYKLITAVANELTYRRYLEDPTNNNQPFRYIDPQGKVTLQPYGRIRAFGYPSQGSYVGIELPATVILAIPVGRLS